jgi:hypothetical protein
MCGVVAKKKDDVDLVLWRNVAKKKKMMLI